ncbi:hypothetical protein N9K06_01115 [Omnitrophica bacterium]|nr:hypothetical protein [Candidatus Omnitrophota bacterium]
MKIKKNIVLKTAFLAAVLFLGHGAATGLFAELPLPTGFDSYQDLPVFSMPDHLKTAETWILNRQKDYQPGKWDEGGFKFETYGLRGDVQVMTSKTESGKEQKKIRFNPLENRTRYLRFFAVPPGSVLVLNYEIEIQKEQAKYSYLDFRIWFGRHLIRHYRIPVDKTQYSEEIPLGVPSFWNRDMVITFELFTGSDARPFFDFSADILK